MNYKKIPFLGKVYDKIKRQDKLIDDIKDQLFFLAKDNINLRLKLKRINNEKINVVFVCNRPTVWGSLKSVYTAMKEDASFNVTMVIIPSKKQIGKRNSGYNHDIYESEGVEEFFKDYNPINGYDKINKKWIQLEDLKPDYVFLQQPYNLKLPVELKSYKISTYAKLCYVAYYAFFQNNENNFINDDCTPIDYLKNLSFYFTQNEADSLFINNKLANNNINYVNVKMSGFPRYDEENLLIKDKKEFITWKNNNENSFKVIWTPRWCTNENNCHFFSYKDYLFNYMENDMSYSFMFRPHPQAFLNWIATGLLNDDDIKKMTERFEKSLNLVLDTQIDYLPNFYSSDCLITDTSSVVDDYFLTGKPIIYCYNKNSLNSFSRNKGYSRGFYFVESWKELKDTLEMLKTGNDPLKEKRKSLINECFYLPKEGAGNFIKNEIKKDFYN